MVGEIRQVLEALDALYAELPDLPCLGLCAHSCTQHVDASATEHPRAHAAGVDLRAPTPTGPAPP